MYTQFSHATTMGYKFLKIRYNLFKTVLSQKCHINGVLTSFSDNTFTLVCTFQRNEWLSRTQPQMGKNWQPNILEQAHSWCINLPEDGFFSRDHVSKLLDLYCIIERAWWSDDACASQ